MQYPHPPSVPYIVPPSVVPHIESPSLRRSGISLKTSARITFVESTIESPLLRRSPIESSPLVPFGWYIKGCRMRLRRENYEVCGYRRYFLVVQTVGRLAVHGCSDRGFESTSSVTFSYFNNRCVFNWCFYKPSDRPRRPGHHGQVLVPSPPSHGTRRMKWGKKLP